jgi:hypothetical protein
MLYCHPETLSISLLMALRRLPNSLPMSRMPLAMTASADWSIAMRMAAIRLEAADGSVHAAFARTSEQDAGGTKFWGIGKKFRLEVLHCVHGG